MPVDDGHCGAGDRDTAVDWDVDFEHTGTPDVSALVDGDPPRSGRGFEFAQVTAGRCRCGPGCGIPVTRPHAVNADSNNKTPSSVFTLMYIPLYEPAKNL